MKRTALALLAAVMVASLAGVSHAAKPEVSPTSQIGICGPYMKTGCVEWF